jgi:hypothetical protein
MSQVIVELELPRDWETFRLPPALNKRLQELLDRQDRDGTLTRGERQEAKALTDLVDMLSLMRLRAERAVRKRLMSNCIPPRLISEVRKRAGNH